MGQEEIKITAHLEPKRPDTCKFSVDRPVYPQGFAAFPTKEKAQGSPLPEKLFEIPEVAAVRLTGNDVTVTKRGSEEWRPVSGKIAEAIRAHIRSGQPAVSADYESQLLSADVIRAKVEEIFKTQINPAVASHGGQVDLLDVKDNKIYLRMGGGCQGCGMADVTLRQGIEVAIREQIPQIAEILDVTDHASGTNPYYAPSKK